jgi:hypothetical protein
MLHYRMQARNIYMMSREYHLAADENFSYHTFRCKLRKMHPILRSCHTLVHHGTRKGKKGRLRQICGKRHDVKARNVWHRAAFFGGTTLLCKLLLASITQ